MLSGAPLSLIEVIMLVNYLLSVYNIPRIPPNDHSNPSSIFDLPRTIKLFLLLAVSSGFIRHVLVTLSHRKALTLGCNPLALTLHNAI